MAKLLAPLALILALLVVSVASDRPLPAADFTFINSGPVNTLDPQRMSYVQDLLMARLLFEPLVRLDVFTEGYEVVPGVAERWEVQRPQHSGREPPPEVYTFHLREDARWSNGEPVTAEHFVFAWRRAILPDSASDYTGLFMAIQGAQEFYDWRESATREFARRSFDNAAQRAAAAEELWAETLRLFDDTVAIDALDSRTLRIVLQRPVPYFLDLCAFGTFSPVYPPLVERFERVDPATAMLKLDSRWTRPPHLVSNGPFQLDRWRFRRDMRLSANPHWWARDTLAIETIDIPIVQDPNAAVLAYETGAAQWVADVTAPYRTRMLEARRAFEREHAAEIERMKAEGLDRFQIDRALPDDPRKHIHPLGVFGTYWYNFNCRERLADGRPNPFADARVRRAFAMAIDKQSIVEHVMRLGNPVARTLIPPGSIGGYESPGGLPCVSNTQGPTEREALLQEARDLLRQAGYPDPSQFPTVEVLFNKSSGHDMIAQAVARDWQRNLGVPVRLVQKELKVFVDDLKNGNFMTSRAGWFGDYGDPTTFLEINRTGDGNNDRGYSSDRYDRLLDRAAAEPDPHGRMQLLAEAEKIIMEEDLPMAPLFHYVRVFLFDPDRLSGLNPHPRLMQNVFLVDVLGDGKGPDRPRVMRPTAGDPPFAAAGQAEAAGPPAGAGP